MDEGEKIYDQYHGEIYLSKLALFISSTSKVYVNKTF